MQYIEITGAKKLSGSIRIHGAKNSALPLLAGSVLLGDECFLYDCPQLSDVTACAEIITQLGGKVSREGSTLTVNTAGINSAEISEELMNKMRSSIIFLGSLSAKHGSACVYLPGGCQIGARPIDLHIMALRALGYSITCDGNNICCRRASASGGTVRLPFASVGATENAILAAVLLDGTSTIINAAREPEIEDLAEFLNTAGAKISGAGSSIIEIEGVRSLSSVHHRIIPDRILAATIMSSVAATGGEAVLKNVRALHLSSVLPVFDEMGCKLFLGNNEIKIISNSRPRAVRSIVTGVYPSFPTDAQAPVMAALCRSKGTSRITETIFENRLRHTEELERFGADISVIGNTATIHGKPKLHAAEARCTDLRAGASVVIAALSAEGTSRIYDISHIDRGYEKIEDGLSMLGASVRRVNDEKGKQIKTENAQTGTHSGDGES